MKNSTLTLICLLFSSSLLAKEHQTSSNEIYKCVDGQSICIFCNDSKDNSQDICIQYKANNYNNNIFMSGDDVATVFSGTPQEFYSYLTKCIAFYNIKESKSIDAKIEGQSVSFSNLSGKTLTLWQKDSSRLWVPKPKYLKGALKAFVKWADKNNIRYKE